MHNILIDDKFLALEIGHIYNNDAIVHFKPQYFAIAIRHHPAYSHKSAMPVFSLDLFDNDGRKFWDVAKPVQNTIQKAIKEYRYEHIREQW